MLRIRGDSLPGPIFRGLVGPLDSSSELEQQVRALERALAKQDGFIRTGVAVVPGSPARLLRATVWASVEQAEAASLAFDGSAPQKALLDLVDTSTGHLEVTVYRTRPGTTREANLARLDAAEGDFAKGKGILGHATWLAPDGQWAHVIQWKSEEDFKRFTAWKGDTL